MTEKDSKVKSKARIAALVKVSENGYDLKSVGKVFQNDEEVVRMAVSRNGTALQFASEDLRNNKDIVLLAIINSKFALESASDDLQHDKDVIRIASLGTASERKYPSLQFESAEKKGNKKIVLEAVKSNGYNLAFVSDALREDRDVILAAYKSLGVK
jgi:hypothetical protein